MIDDTFVISYLSKLISLKLIQLECYVLNDLIKFPILHGILQDLCSM